MAEPALAHVSPDASACSRCGTELAPSLLVCPRVIWLPFIGASWAVFTMKAAVRADIRAVGYYVALVGALAVLAALCRVPI